MAKNQLAHTKAAYAWALARISLGLIFLWGFFDKLFGLGFTTCRDPETGATELLCGSAWLESGSPTSGFLTFATKGPFADIFQALAGVALVDWLFMLGLLGLGVALTLGIATRLAGYGGAVLMVLMWLAAFPPEHHPFLSEHVVYALVLTGVALTGEHKLAWSNRLRETSLLRRL